MIHIGSNSPVATFFSPACKILISSDHRCRKNTIDHQKASYSGFFHQSLGVFTENKYPGIGSDVHQHTGPLITSHLQKPRKNPSQNKRNTQPAGHFRDKFRKTPQRSQRKTVQKSDPEVADRSASERSFLLQQAL